MQTFLPYPNFAASATALDYKRLGKQRVEAYQILKTLLGLSQGWKNHPAVKMWRGHEGALAVYALCMIDEWVKRGYKDTLGAKVTALFSEHELHKRGDLPSWLGDEAFHASHRANLLRKDHIFYSKYGWIEDPTLPYVWP